MKFQRVIEACFEPSKPEDEQYLCAECRLSLTSAPVWFKRGYVSVIVIPANKLKAFTMLIGRTRQATLIGEPMRIRSKWVAVVHRKKTATNVKWLDVVKKYAEVLDIDARTINDVRKALREGTDTMTRNRILEMLEVLETPQPPEPVGKPNR